MAREERRSSESRRKPRNRCKKRPSVEVRQGSGNPGFWIAPRRAAVRVRLAPSGLRGTCGRRRLRGRLSLFWSDPRDAPGSDSVDSDLKPAVPGASGRSRSFVNFVRPADSSRGETKNGRGSLHKLRERGSSPACGRGCMRSSRPRSSLSLCALTLLSIGLLVTGGAAQGAATGSLVPWGGCGLVGQCNVPAAAASGVTAIAVGPFQDLALMPDSSVIALGLRPRRLRGMHRPGGGRRRRDGDRRGSRP